MTDLQIYEKYCHNKPRSESLWRQCSDCAFFQVIGSLSQLRESRRLENNNLDTRSSLYIKFICVYTCKQNKMSFFFLHQECQKKLEHKLGLDSYLLKPVQRITKYQLLLKVRCPPQRDADSVSLHSRRSTHSLLCRVWPQEMLKYSKGCEGADDLQEALSSILGILKAVNDSMHLIAITGYEVRSSMSETDAGLF